MPDDVVTGLLATAPPPSPSPLDGLLGPVGSAMAEDNDLQRLKEFTKSRPEAEKLRRQLEDIAAQTQAVANPTALKQSIYREATDPDLAKWNARSEDLQQRLNEPPDPKYKAAMASSLGLPPGTDPSIDYFQQKRLQDAYGRGKMGTASRFLADVLRGRGKPTVEQAAQDAALKDYEGLFKTAQDKVNQERLLMQNELTNISQQKQQRGQLSLEAHRNAQDEDARDKLRLGALKDSADILGKDASQLTREQQLQAQVAKGVFQLKYGDKPLDKAFLALTQDLMGHYNMDENQAKSRAMLLLTQMKAQEKVDKPVRVGTDTVQGQGKFITDGQGNSVFQPGATSSRGVFEAAPAHGSQPGMDFFNKVFGIQSPAATTPPFVPGQRIYQGPDLQGPPQQGPAHFAQPQTSPDSSQFFAPSSEPMDAVTHRKRADEITNANRTSGEADTLLNGALAAAFTPSEKGTPAAREFMGPAKGNKLANSLRSLFPNTEFGEVTPYETLVQRTGLDAAMEQAKSKLQRVTNIELNQVLATMPHTSNNYEAFLSRAAMYNLLSQANEQRAVNPKAKLTPTDINKMGKEVDRLVGTVRAVTHGGDLDKPLDPTTVEKFRGSLRLKNLREVLNSPSPKGQATGASGSPAPTGIRKVVRDANGKLVYQ